MSEIALSPAEKAAAQEFMKQRPDFKKSEGNSERLLAQLAKVLRPWNDAKMFCEAWDAAEIEAFNQETAPHANPTDTLPSADAELISRGDHEILNDDRILKCISRDKKWEAVFGTEEFAAFSARNPKIATPIHFCNFISRYTNSRAQMERILQRSVYSAFKNWDASITEALEEAAKKRTPLFDTRNRADVIWQWEGYVPLGKLVVIDGDPGLAKSMFALRIAVSTFSGKPFLDGTKPATTGGVVLLSAEDDPVDTIAPRLVAAGAPDGEIPLIFQPPTKEDGEAFNLDDSGDRLELELKIVHVNAKLVIIDPVNAYLGEKVDSHNDQKVRRVLGPLSEIANRTRATILCLRHVTKGGGTKAIYRGQGSIAYTAAARANFFVAEHPDNNGTFVFAASKFNIGPKPSSLAYRIALAEVTGIVKQVPYVAGGEPCSLTANELAAAEDRKMESEGGKLGDAVDFLRAMLADGEVAVKEIERRADKQGIKPMTLRRAKEALKVQARPDGKKWFWSLPEEERQTNIPF